MKKTSFEFIRSAAQASDFPPAELPEVAFVGRSNVGKSSLLNALTGTRKLAYVSKTPGRTQLVNFFRREGEVTFVDLPGYGFAKAPPSIRRKWESLVTSYLFERETLCLALLLVDSRREPMEIDREVRDLLVEGGVPHAVVATKSDKLSRSRLQQRRRELEKVYGPGPGDGVPLLTFSAVTNEGRKELWKVIETHTREAKRAPKR